MKSPYEQKMEEAGHHRLKVWVPAEYVEYMTDVAAELRRVSSTKGAKPEIPKPYTFVRGRG